MALTEHLIPELKAITDIYSQEAFPRLKEWIIDYLGPMCGGTPRDLDVKAKQIYDAFEATGKADEISRWILPELRGDEGLIDEQKSALDDDLSDIVYPIKRRILLEISDLPLWALSNLSRRFPDNDGDYAIEDSLIRAFTLDRQRLLSLR